MYCGEKVSARVVAAAPRYLPPFGFGHRLRLLIWRRRRRTEEEEEEHAQWQCVAVTSAAAAAAAAAAAEISPVANCRNSNNNNNNNNNAGMECCQNFWSFCVPFPKYGKSKKLLLRLQHSWITFATTLPLGANFFLKKIKTKLARRCAYAKMTSWEKH
jgi:hypothetical protein